jgi:hypothetical protein
VTTSTAISRNERLPVDQQGPEDDHDPAIIAERQEELRAIGRSQSAIIQSPTVRIARPRTPAVTSDTSTEEREEPTDEGGEPEHIQVHAPEVDALAAQAELLHLPPHDESMATQTQMQVREGTSLHSHQSRHWTRHERG